MSWRINFAKCILDGTGSDITFYSVNITKMNVLICVCIIIRKAFHPIEFSAKKRAIKCAMKQLKKYGIHFVKRTSKNQGTYPNYVSFESSSVG